MMSVLRNSYPIGSTRLDLLARPPRHLGIDDVDVDDAQLEPRILHEYFDFRFMLRKYGLTRA